MASGSPWEKPGKNGKPNGHRRPAAPQSQLEARVLATMRTELHNALTYQPKVPEQGQGRAKDWSHRKAEWICACGESNFVDREKCRKCGQQWNSKFTLVPAGSPPPQKAGRSATAVAEAQQKPPAPPKPNATPEEQALTSARQALESAKQAQLGEEVIAKLQEAVQTKQQSLDATQSKRLPRRFADASQKEKETSEQLQKAERALEAAQACLETAKKAHQDASAQLTAIQAEIAAAGQATGKTAASPDPTKDAAHEEAEALQEILQAYRQTIAEGAALDTRTNLEALLKGAAAKAEARAKEAEEARAAAAAAGAVPEAQAMGVDRAEAIKRKSAEGEHTSTQPGNEDLDEEALDKLLQGIPAGKRQRARERLTQMDAAG